MDEQIIQNWLADSASLSPGEVNIFADNLKHNNELIRALFLLLDDYLKFHDLIEPISKQLFNYYRSRESALKLFTLQFLPNLIYIYLNSIARGDKKSYHSIETLLIGIYNLEVVDDIGQPAIISFRMPSLAQASIYHEPMSLAHVSLTETALRRLEECNTKLISWGPYHQVEQLNAQNRLQTITRLLFIYNRHIGAFNKLSLKNLCKVASSLASQGFHHGDYISGSDLVNGEGSKPVKLSRIPVTFQLFLELLCGLYYAMYNDFERLAVQAVDDIYNRSCYECFANVIAVANAIKNSHRISSSGLENEGSMGISVGLSSATTTVTTVNKFMITNASFRTKKLPDDIPIVQKEESGNAGTEIQKPLSSITEEKEEIGFPLRGNSLRSKDAVAKNFQKLGIVKKFKEKDGKCISKGNFTGNSSGGDRKQPILVQVPTFKEKASSKSGFPSFQKGDLPVAELNGLNAPQSSGRCKGGDGERTGSASASADALPERSSAQSDFQNETETTSMAFESPATEVFATFASPKSFDEKSFAKVSSV